MELEPKAYANAYAKPTQNIRGRWLSFGVKMWLSFKQIALHSIFGGFTYWSKVLQLQMIHVPFLDEKIQVKSN